MSGSAHSKRKPLDWFAGLAGLALCIGLVWFEPQWVSNPSMRFAIVAALGFLLLAGTLAAELLAPLGLPHLTAYIAVGIVAGPHVLGLVSHDTAKHLAPVNALAIALIALAGGLELELEALRRVLRSVLVANLIQTLVVGGVTAAAFVLAVPYLPFLRGLALPAVFGSALLWGVLATSRSPSATLAVIAQTRARGPLTNWSLAFVMTSDVFVVVLAALAMVVARPLLTDATEFSPQRLGALVHEILGSTSLGVTLGLLVAIYIRLVGKMLILLLLVLGFVVTDALRYIEFDPLLAFLVAGFVIRNLTSQGEQLLKAVERTSGVVFVAFFATAGAHLDIPLLARTWPIALAFAITRALATWAAARTAAAVTRDPPLVRRWSVTALVSQAGLTLALSAGIEREFPQLGAGFRSLVLATVALNEVFGPILFKLALDRAKETAPMSTAEVST